MKKKIIVILAILIVVIGVGAFLLIPKSKSTKKEFQFTEIVKGSLKNVVSCTGTIKAKGTVEVGTQVSGTIAKVNADYNDSVKKDQVLAMIDSTLLEIAVTQAESELAKSSSSYEHDLKNYENNVKLHDKKLVSDYDLEAAKVTLDASYSAKLTAETNLKKAKSNLSYAIIRSPISGTVIDRNIEEGQTIAASYSTPTLFKIAEDLSNMQIYALVDENDIGKIKLNQNVVFTVESYPEEEFKGIVTQIRLEPVTVSNVVNYYVIINAKNEKHFLLPGMTATIDILIQEKNDVLIVANSALKFKPTPDMFAGLNKNPGNMPPQKSGSIQGNAVPDKNSTQLWYLDADGSLKPVNVKTGLTDGQNTEILDNPELSEGQNVITGSSGSETAAKTVKSQNNQQMGPPPMF